MILFDDFVQNTEQVYRETLEFLGVDREFSPGEFAAINRGQRPIWPCLVKWTHHPPHWWRRSADWVKTTFGLKRVGILRTVASWNSRAAPRPKLDGDFERDLRCFLESEIERIEAIFGRKLPEWRS